MRFEAASLLKRPGPPSATTTSPLQMVVTTRYASPVTHDGLGFGASPSPRTSKLGALGSGVGKFLAGIFAIALMLVTGFGGLIVWGSKGSQNQQALTSWFATVKQNGAFMKQKADLAGVFNFMSNPGPSTSPGFSSGCSDLMNVVANMPARPPVPSVAKTWTALENDVAMLHAKCAALISDGSQGLSLTDDITQLTNAASSLQVDASRFAASVKAATGQSGLQKAQSDLGDFGL